MEQTAYPPNHYIRWVAELKVETLNEVEQLETNIVGKTAFAYIGKKSRTNIFKKEYSRTNIFKKEYSRTHTMLQIYWSKYSRTLV